MLRLFTACAVASGLALAIATPALAQKGGAGTGHATGGATMTQGGGQTMDRSNGATAIDRDKGLDRAQDRDRRNQTQAPNRNSNGVNAIDRDKGLGRAEDRRNDHDADDLKR